MIVAKAFAGKTVAILGLARSGASAARALVEGGARVLAWDEREDMRKSVPAGTTLAPIESWPWHEISALVLSPGIPLTHPKPHPVVLSAREAGVEIIGDVEVFARFIRPSASQPGLAPVIAITGTNGKSTTTALIGHILSSCGFDAQIGGNIGRGVLDLAPPGRNTVYVLEISSYQIDLAPGLKADVALLTNLSPDHIDRHGSMENYASVKAGLLERASADGHVVVGIDDPHAASIYTRLAAKDGAGAIAVSVGKVLGRGVFVVDGHLYDAWGQSTKGQPAKDVGDLKAAAKLPGTHNWQNAALAYAAVKRLVGDSHAIMEAIKSFPGLAHRIEEIGRIGKARFINDSKATNADAAARALACYADIFWIAGGKAKEGGIANLAPYFPRVRRAYLIGEAANEFAATLTGKVDYVLSGTLKRALDDAAADAAVSKAPDPVVLLSPACASFDQFRDFEQRGDIFRDEVKKLIASPHSVGATV